MSRGRLIASSTAALAAVVALIGAAPQASSAARLKRQPTTTTSTPSASTTSTTVAAAAATSFQASGLDAGSTVPTIAADPSGSGVLLAGSNVGGVFRSTDGGGTWAAANTGITVGGLSVASLAYSTSVPAKVYAALGNKGPGGVEASSDGGQTWSVRSTTPQFNGANPYTNVLPSGKMLAPASNGYLYAATTNSGVLRSTDDGATWAAIGLPTSSGAALRGLIVSATNPDLVYVANYGIGNASFPSGLYVSTNATSATPTFTAVPGAPADVEDLTMVGSTLYVAADTSGVLATSGGGTSWSVLIAPNNARWASVAGIQPAGAAPVLYAGAATPRADSAGGYDSLLKSTDGGATWKAVTAGSSVHTTEGGPTGRAWWLAAVHPEMMLGGASFIPRQLAINPANPNNVAVTGRADVFATTDGGSNWYPMVRGLSTTVERGVIADPKQSGTSYAIGYDWGVVGSSDDMQHVTGITPSGASAALDIALDTATTPSTVYVAGFDESAPSTTTDVSSNLNPLGGGTWTSLGLKAATGGASVFGITVRRVSSVPVVLAAVGVSAGGTCSSQCGVWRKVGAGSWSRVTGPMAAAEGAFHASFSWPTASGPVYLFDPGTGLWRSADAGVTWTKIWARPYNNDMTGYLAAPPASPGTVFVSLGTLGLYRLTGADTGAAVGNGITAATVGSFTGAGATTVAPNGTIWLTQVAPYGTGISRSSDNGSTWTSVDDATYRNLADFPTGVSVSSTGRVLVATRGDGVVSSN